MAGSNPAMIIRIAATLDELKRNLAEGKSQIETTTQAMAKLSASFDGSKITQQAMNVTAAISKLGGEYGVVAGAAKLTAAEQERVNSVVSRALEKYQALGKEAPAGMRELAEATRSLGPPTQTAATSFTTLVGSIVTAQVVVNAAREAWRTFTGFISSSVESYLAAEAAQSKLTAALRAAGQAAPQTVSEFNALATTFQKTTVYSDDLITEMQALLVQVGGVMPSQMKGALTAATNLASGLGIDLRTATMLVGKAFEGETGTLKRYGIVIDEAKLKAEGLPAVLDAVNSKFGGQAQAAIETTAGKIKQLANEWDNLKEAVGGSIVNDPLVVAILERLTKGATDAAEASTKLSKATTDLERDEIRAAEAVNQLNLENDDFFTAAVLRGVPGLLALRQQVDGLRQSYADAQEEAAALARAVAAIPKATGLPTATAVPKPPPLPEGLLDGTWERQQKAVNKAMADGAAAAAAYTKAVQVLASAWTSANVDEEIKKLSDALKVAAASGDLTEAGVKKLVEAYLKLRAQVNPNALPKEMTDLDRVTMAYLGTLSKLTVGLDKVPGLFLGVERAINDIELALIAVGPPLDAFGYMVGTRIGKEALPDALMSIDEIIDAMQRIPNETAPAVTSFERLGSVLSSVFDNINGTLGQSMQLIGGALEAIGKQGAVMGDKLIAGFSAAAGVIGQYAQASVIASIATGALSGASAGVALAMAQNVAIGTAAGAAFVGIGAAVGALVGYFQYAAQKAAALRQANVEATESIEEMKKSILDMYGSVSSLKTIGEIIGMDLVGGWGHQGVEGLKAFREQVEAFMDRMQDLTENIEANAGLADAVMLRLIDHFETVKETAGVANDFILANVNNAAAGLNALTAALEEAGGLTSRLQATGLAEAVVGVFGELIARGASLREALEAVQPSIDAMREALDAAGMEGGAAFEFLAEMARMAADETMGPLVDAFAGARDALTGLHNAGLLTQDSFAAIAMTATQAYEAILAAGGDGTAALAAMAPTLQTIWKLQQDFGYAVDAGTQALLDQAEAAGLVGAMRLSDAERQTAAQEKLVAIMGELLGFFQRLIPATDQWGAAAAAAGQTAADALTRASVAARKAGTDIDDLGTAGQRAAESIAALPEILDKFEIPEIIFDTNAKDVIEEVEELSRVIGKVPKKVDIEAELKGSGFKTIEEMEAAAGKALRIWAEMVKSGKYSASEIEKAWKAAQDAFKAITPELDELGQRAAAAGYKSTAALKEAATSAEKLWRDMVASGRFGADELKRAWEDWQDKLNDADLGGMSKALRDELSKLKEMVKAEADAPEYDELGKRIFGVDEQAAMDRIKQIEDEAKRAGEAVAGAADKIQGKVGETVVNISVGMSKSAFLARREFEALGLNASGAMAVITGEAVKAREKIDEIHMLVEDLDDTFVETDWREPFDDIRDGAVEAKPAVDDLYESIKKITEGESPGGMKEWSPMMTAAAQTAASTSDRMVQDFERIANAVNRVNYRADEPRQDYDLDGSRYGISGPSSRGVAAPVGGAPPMSDSRAVEELRAIRRDLAAHQPDVLFVPMKPGDTMESLEERLADRLPRRITQSATFRNAMQRAINGTS